MADYLGWMSIPLGLIFMSKMIDLAELFGTEIEVFNLKIAMLNL